ncbi:hypothetical protein BGX28_003224 [Mortierella sp. GBA30]|nr:hypothetical protein BGX28_003224 [Mortierella sp. GBA30]
MESDLIQLIRLKIHSLTSALQHTIQPTARDMDPVEPPLHNQRPPYTATVPAPPHSIAPESKLAYVVISDTESDEDIDHAVDVVHAASDEDVDQDLVHSASDDDFDQSIFHSASDVDYDQDIIDISSDENGYQDMEVGLSESSFDEEYEYGADPHMDGHLEIQPNLPPPSRLDVDFVDMMNKSYRSSRDQLLTYQQRMLENNRRRKQLSSHVRGPSIAQPVDITKEELDIIINQVAAYTRTLKQVDWTAVSIPKRPLTDWMTMQSKTSMLNLLGKRELGTRNSHLVKDMILLRKLKDYVCATSFNYSSGSVVDMALKTSTMKLAVANVATQDMYNRPGNLLLCDLKKGQTMQLQGHSHRDERLSQQMTETVNDIKLAYSRNFFVSGSDDHKTKIWNAETGECVNTIEGYESRVNRVAIMEHSHGEDIFATCSAEGALNIHALDEEGQVYAENKKLVAPGGRRGISSISFGYGHFWDCLAAGLEGTDMGGTEGSLHGQVAFYDANYQERVAVTELGFGYVGSGQTAKSVSCLSFSPTGRLLACGTSGRTVAVDEERGDGLLRVFDVGRAKIVQTIESGHEDVNLVEFSPCEQYVISGSHNNEMAIFDIRFLGKDPLHRFQHLTNMDDDSNAGITSVLWWPSSFSTNQPVLISGGGDGAIKLWDIRRATEDAEIWSLEANLGPIARLTASESFEHLIVGGDTGAVSVFTLDHGLVSKYKERPMALLSDNE